MATTPSNLPLWHSWRNSARLVAVDLISSPMSLRDCQASCALSICQFSGGRSERVRDVLVNVAN